MFAAAVGTGAPGEGEEAVQRPGPGSHQAPAASQSHSGAADQREGHSEDTTGAPGRQGEATVIVRRSVLTLKVGSAVVWHRQTFLHSTGKNLAAPVIILV